MAGCMRDGGARDLPMPIGSLIADFPGGIGVERAARYRAVMRLFLRGGGRVVPLTLDDLARDLPDDLIGFEREIARFLAQSGLITRDKSCGQGRIVIFVATPAGIELAHALREHGL